MEAQIFLDNLEEDNEIIEKYNSLLKMPCNRDIGFFNRTWEELHENRMLSEDEAIYDVHWPESILNGNGCFSYYSKAEIFTQMMVLIDNYINYDKYLKKQIEEDFKKAKLEFFRLPPKTKENNNKKQLPEEDGYIYIIKLFNFYKIGKTKNPKNRLGEYTKLPMPSEKIICELCKNYHNLEKELHFHFSCKRTNGEWFQLNDEELKEAIKIIQKNGVK